MRHRVGQLDSIKSVPYEELELMRTENEARLKVLEEQYWGAQEAREVGPKIRERYKQYGKTADSTTTPPATKSLSGKDGKRRRSPSKGSRKGLDNLGDDSYVPETSTPGPPGILKKSGQYGGGSRKRTPGPKYGQDDDDVGYGDGDEERGSLAKPKFDHRNLRKSGSGKRRSRSKSGKHRSTSPVVEADPRQQIYEAKFEKYLANKKVKQEQDKRKTVGIKEEFDIYTKGPSSPSKMTKRFKQNVDPTETRFSGKYHEEDLIPPEHEEDILRQEELKKQQRVSYGDPFQDLGVDTADKMTFFLLKWVFNAIKRDSADDDPKFKGHSYVSKNDLVK